MQHTRTVFMSFISEGVDLNTCDVYGIVYKMATIREYVEGLLCNERIRHTNKTPKRIYVYDFIQYMTDVADPKRAYARLIRKDPDITTMVEMYSQDGSRHVPVTDIRGMYKIANWSKGRNAVEFRTQVSMMMLRFYGGDASLINEVRENAQSNGIVRQFL